MAARSPRSGQRPVSLARTGDHYTAIGLEAYKANQRIWPRLLLFGSLLLLSHVLNIKPSELDAGGIRIEVEDVVVVHGALALVFLYYLWSLLLGDVQGSSLLPSELSRRTLRSVLKDAAMPRRDKATTRLKKPTPQRIKQVARLSMLTYNLLRRPFDAVIGLVVVSALVMGLIDTWSFGSYLFGRIV